MSRLDIKHLAIPAKCLVISFWRVKTIISMYRESIGVSSILESYDIPEKSSTNPRKTLGFVLSYPDIHLAISPGTAPVPKGSATKPQAKSCLVTHPASRAPSTPAQEVETEMIKGETQRKL